MTTLNLNFKYFLGYDGPGPDRAFKGEGTHWATLVWSAGRVRVVGQLSEGYHLGEYWYDEMRPNMRYPTAQAAMDAACEREGVESPQVPGHQWVVARYPDATVISTHPTRTAAVAAMIDAGHVYQPFPTPTTVDIGAIAS